MQPHRKKAPAPPRNQGNASNHLFSHTGHGASHHLAKRASSSVLLRKLRGGRPPFANSHRIHTFFASLLKGATGMLNELKVHFILRVNM